MKTWEVPVYWTMSGAVSVEADTLEKAIDLARDMAVNIPSVGTYVDDSWEADSDVEYVREYLNDGQEDEVE